MYISKFARKYLMFAEVVFVTSAVICIALFFNLFGFIDEVNSYIIAVQLSDSLLRMTAVAVMMAVIIDLLVRDFE